MNEEIKLDANAKINITMGVSAKRGDGYHGVVTVMQSISLSDTVSVALEREPGIRVKTNTRRIPADMSNTAAKAAAVFLETAEQTGRGVRIGLVKNIPSGAGMGGGSADAAAALHALNTLLGTRYPLEKLAEIGGKAGSDIPFCVYGGTRLATGRGEITTPLPNLPPCHILIAKPAFSLPTSEMFAAFDKAKITRQPDSDGLIQALEASNFAETARRAYNVFEEALPAARRQEIESIKMRMIDSGASGASMTGSGSAVFGLYDNESGAKHAFELLKRDYKECYLTTPTGGREHD